MQEQAEKTIKVKKGNKEYPVVWQPATDAGFAQFIRDIKTNLETYGKIGHFPARKNKYFKHELEKALRDNEGLSPEMQAAAINLILIRAAKPAALSRGTERKDESFLYQLAVSGIKQYQAVQQLGVQKTTEREELLTNQSLQITTLNKEKLDIIEAHNKKVAEMETHHEIQLAESAKLTENAVAEVPKIKEEARKLEEELKAKKLELENKIAAIDQDATKKHLQSQVDELTQKLDAAHQTLGEAEAKNKQQEETITGFQQTLQELIEENKKKVEKIEEKSKKIIENLKNENAKVTADQQSLIFQATGTASSYKQLDEENTKLRDRNEALVLSLTAVNAQVGNVSDKKVELEKEIEQLKKDIKAKDGLISRLYSVVKKLLQVSFAKVVSNKLDDKEKANNEEIIAVIREAEKIIEQPAIKVETLVSYAELYKEHPPVVKAKTASFMAAVNASKDAVQQKDVNLAKVSAEPQAEKENYEAAVVAIPTQEYRPKTRLAKIASPVAQAPAVLPEASVEPTSSKETVVALQADKPSSDVATMTKIGLLANKDTVSEKKPEAANTANATLKERLWAKLTK